MSQPRILVISPSNLATDPRVNRQLRLLQNSSRLTAAGHVDPQLSGVEFVPLATDPKTWPARTGRLTRLFFRRFGSYYDRLGFVRSARAALSGRTFDLIIANDALTWPLALGLRGPARLLFDAHEFAPKEFEDIAWWRLFHQPHRVHLCRHYLPRADGTLTVCPGIAEEYEKVFGVRPLVVMNTPPGESLAPSTPDGDNVRMVHHGGALRSRQIEKMIRMLDHLDERFTLDLILAPSDQAYWNELKDLAESRPRVRFLDPVPMREIPARISRYDLGLYLLAPNSFNNLHALPNKFFEYIQARLAVAIGPSPEMARIVRADDCGVVAGDFNPASLAQALRTITRDQLVRWKQNSDVAARRLCWEKESQILAHEIERLLALGPCAA